MDNTSNTGSELDQNFTIASGAFPAHSFFDVFVTLSGSEIGPGFTPFTGTAFSLNIYDSGSGELDAQFPGQSPTGTVDGTVFSPLRVRPQVIILSAYPSRRAWCCWGWGWEPSRHPAGSATAALLDAHRSTGTAGILVWSLAFFNQNRWPSEITPPNLNANNWFWRVGASRPRLTQASSPWRIKKTQSEEISAVFLRRVRRVSPCLSSSHRSRDGRESPSESGSPP